MRDTVTLDKAGRIGLPKALRDTLHLAAGDTLDIAVEGEQVTLRPRRILPPLQKERGVWVFRTGEPFATEQTREAVNAIREQPRSLPALRQDGRLLRRAQPGRHLRHPDRHAERATGEPPRMAALQQVTYD